MIHTLHPNLTERFHIALVGAGGSGSQMLTCLGRLHHALTALGHPGFDVMVFDPDTVSEANLGRQMFARGDVGLHKASVLVHRVNQFFGLGWHALPLRYKHSPSGHGSGYDLVISCVDTTASRREIDSALRGQYKPAYLLDLGNRAADGQAILGQYTGTSAVKKTPAGTLWLPTPYELLPELVSTTTPTDDAPSCSLAEALERQELFVNDDVVRAGCLILWNLLRHGQISWHGAFVNCKTGRRSPLPVDPEVWKRMRASATSTTRTARPTKPARRKTA